MTRGETFSVPAELGILYIQPSSKSRFTPHPGGRTPPASFARRTTKGTMKIQTNKRLRQRGSFLIEALLMIATVAVVMTTVFPVLVEHVGTPTPTRTTCAVCGMYTPCYNHTK